jgi:Zn-dependent protease
LAVIIGPTTLPGFICAAIGFINAFIGGFNLIPIPPFDGSKIIRWNIGVYILMVAGAVALVAAYYLWL